MYRRKWWHIVCFETEKKKWYKNRVSEGGKKPKRGIDIITKKRLNQNILDQSGKWRWHETMVTWWGHQPHDLHIELISEITVNRELRLREFTGKIQICRKSLKKKKNKKIIKKKHECFFSRKLACYDQPYRLLNNENLIPRDFESQLAMKDVINFHMPVSLTKNGLVHLNTDEQHSIAGL